MIDEVGQKWKVKNNHKPKEKVKINKSICEILSKIKKDGVYLKK